MEDPRDDDEAAAADAALHDNTTPGARAYASIATQLQSFTSPKLGTVQFTSPTVYSYERDPTEWLRRDDYDVMEEEEQEEDDALMMDATKDDEYEAKIPLSTPPKRMMFARANTPVMSNVESSKKKKKKLRQSSSATPEMPVNVQSPWQQQPAVRNEDDDAAQKQQQQRTMILARSNPSLKASSHADYRRYHEALVSYLKAKRSLAERMELERQERQLADSTTASDDDDDRDLPMDLTDQNGQQQHIVNDETRIEIEFLRSLTRISYDRASVIIETTKSSTTTSSSGSNDLETDPAFQEGNFWSLLSFLRPTMGLASLLWDDDEASQRQHATTLEVFLQTLANRVYETPQELIQATHVVDSATTRARRRRHHPEPDVLVVPLLLQRRRLVLRWLESCFDLTLPSGVTRPLQTNTVVSSNNNNKLQQQGLPETGKDAALAKASLALMLAGRLDDAMTLARKSGVPWRAAAWSGGTPQGYQQQSKKAISTTFSTSTGSELEEKSVGNPRRALWRRMMWLQSQHLNTDPASIDDEGAIAAILSNHVKDALANASLRSWTKGLYVTLRSILGRMEDELLHMHNNNRRQMRPPFPGTEYKDKEEEQLLATSDIATMNEADVLHMLASSPFEEMQVSGPIVEATASFLVGKNAVITYLETAISQLDSIEDETYLRFLTHLALYLDSLSEGTTAITVSAGSEWKDQVLLLYLQFLASREDLWYLLVLYASLLPEQTLVEYLPNLLSPIESQEEREIIVGQLSEYLPKAGLDLVILRCIVRIVLSEDESLSVPDTPTRLDVRKMKSILWLSFSEQHSGDALISANVLLRQFLLADKLAAAFMFVEDILPDDILHKVMVVTPPSPTFDDDDDKAVSSLLLDRQIEHARSEYVAFLSYLDAIKAVEQWKEVITSTDAAPAVVDDRIDTSQLNTTEAEIALSLERRELVQEKRKLSLSVVSASDKAQKRLKSVLEHPGGWLLTEDEAIAGGVDEVVRRTELQALRVKLLPHVVMLYHEVCMETAAWMSASLDDAMERLKLPSESALSTLDDTEDSSCSPLSPHFWTEMALQLAQLVTSDTYSIKSAFGTAEFKELLSMFADSKVQDLLSSSKRDKYVSNL